MSALKYWLYSVSTAAFFFLVFSWFYIAEIQPRFAYAWFSYQFDVADTYYILTFLAFVLAIALMPQREIPSNIFVLVIIIFVFNGDLQVAIHFMPDADRSYVLINLVAAGLILSIFSRIEIPLRIQGSGCFEYFVYILFAALFCLIAGTAYFQGLQLVGFWESIQLREQLSLPAVSRYALSLYTFSVGPIFIAMMLYRGRRLIILLALVPYLFGYLFTFQKFTLLCPLLIFGMWAGSKYRIMRLPAGQLLLFTAPFIASAVWFSLDLPGRDAVVGLISTRLYTVPGQLFGHYLDFFSIHPNTWFSHVTGINWFIEYPYSNPIPLVLKDSYPGGNQNASFWSSDAIAGAGYLALIPVTIVFATILGVINSVCRGLDPRFTLTACCVIAYNFANGSLATGLLSGGLILTIILLALAPRSRYGCQARVKLPHGANSV